MSSVVKLGFDCHLKSRGCHSTYSRWCTPACSKLDVESKSGSRGNGNNNMHEVYHSLHTSQISRVVWLSIISPHGRLIFKTSSILKMLCHLSGFWIQKYQTHQQNVIHMVRKASKLSFSIWSRSSSRVIVGVECAMPPFISSDWQMELNTFQRYITNHPKEDMNEQLKELSTSSMLNTMGPSKCMSDPSSRNCFSGTLLLLKW